MGLVKEKMTHLENQQTNGRTWDACGPHCLPKQKNKTKESNNRPLWFESPPVLFLSSPQEWLLLYLKKEEDCNLNSR